MGAVLTTDALIVGVQLISNNMDPIEQKIRETILAIDGSENSKKAALAAILKLRKEQKYATADKVIETLSHDMKWDSEEQRKAGVELYKDAYRTSWQDKL